MVFSVVVARSSDLLALGIKSPCHAVARVTLLARLRIARTPNELLRARYGTVNFLHDLRALVKAVVGELASVRATRDSSHGSPDPIQTPAFHRW